MILGLSISQDTLVAAVSSGRRLEWVAASTYRDVPDLSETIARLSSERPAGVRSARVALTGNVVQTRVLGDLPRLSARELRRMIALAPKRYFLVNGTRVVTDATVLSKGASTTGLIAAAAEPLVAAIASSIESAGLRLDCLSPIVAWPGSALPNALALTGSMPENGSECLAAVMASCGRPWAISLVPPSSRIAEMERGRRTVQRWSVITAASMALAFMSYSAGISREVATTNNALRAVTPELAEGLATRQDLDKVVSAIAFARDGAGMRTRSARIITSVSRALPQGAYLSTLRIGADQSVVLSGLSTSAASALAALEKTRLGSFQIIGPIIREVSGDREMERFTIQSRAAP
jgi:hypothetical protein